MRLRLVAALLPLCTGCASAIVDDDIATGDDELVGDSDLSSPTGSFTYFQITADLRKCPAPGCGGWFVQRLNHTATECWNGVSSDSCYVPWLDWSQARLSDESRATLLDACVQGANAEGTIAIVRGHMGDERNAFVLTEAWIAETAAVSSGPFVRITDNGMRCLQAPCPSLTEKRLNSHRSVDIAELDLSAAGLTVEQTDALLAAETGPRGILVAGHRYDYYENGQFAHGRAVTAAYRKLPEGRTCGTPDGALAQ
jgi:hypothetical protein